MSMIKQLMEFLAEAEDQQPKVGDMVYNPQKTAITNEYGTVKKITGDSASVSIGGPSPISVSLSKFHSPKTFTSDDPVWKGLSGKKTIWRVK